MHPGVAGRTSAGQCAGSLACARIPVGEEPGQSVCFRFPIPGLKREAAARAWTIAQPKERPSRHAAGRRQEPVSATGSGLLR